MTHGTISDALPTSSRVLQLLDSYPIVHFACHGISDPGDPSLSRLLLHDHETAPLTISALNPLHLDHAHLAYLSACQTMLTTDIHLLDESIHLSSAFLIAGYRHVIGTLWTINDRISAQIADTFYATLTEHQAAGPDFTRTAHALHDAIRTIRDRFPMTPSLWAAYLHVGA